MLLNSKVPHRRRAHQTGLGFDKESGTYSIFFPGRVLCVGPEMPFKEAVAWESITLDNLKLLFSFWGSNKNGKVELVRTKGIEDASAVDFSVYIDNPELFTTDPVAIFSDAASSVFENLGITDADIPVAPPEEVKKLAEKFRYTITLNMAKDCFIEFPGLWPDEYDEGERDVLFAHQSKKPSEPMAEGRESVNSWYDWEYREPWMGQAPDSDEDEDEDEDEEDRDFTKYNVRLTLDSTKPGESRKVVMLEVGQVREYFKRLAHYERFNGCHDAIATLKETKQFGSSVEGMGKWTHSFEAHDIIEAMTLAAFPRGAVYSHCEDHCEEGVKAFKWGPDFFTFRDETILKVRALTLGPGVGAPPDSDSDSDSDSLSVGGGGGGGGGEGGGGGAPSP